jgi:hypothetical protein
MRLPEEARRAYDSSIMDQWQVIEALRPTWKEPADLHELETLPFPRRYLEIIEHVGVQEIASDFVLPPSMHLVVENLRVASRANGWLVFAVSASGDLWLLRADPNEDQIAFMPQDEASAALPEPLGIGLHQWFQLGLLLRSHEAAMARARSESERRALKTRAKQQLEAIAKGLAQRYPYSL